MFKSITRKDTLCLLSLFLIFTLALLVFSCYTSPLYPNLLGYDSAIFSLLGKGLVEGKELYVDLFDHKGPFIFFINALGHLLGGRNGIFILQCISGFFTIGTLYFTSKKLRPVGTYFFEHIFIFALGMATFFYTFECGNLTEEYSLPFIAGCCSFFISYAINAEHKPEHPPIYALFYGISLAILALMRLNNAVTICTGILIIFIYLCYRKQYVNLLHNLLAGIVGLLLVFVPVLVYFSLHNSISEMIYATFLHNFTIIQNTSRISIFSKKSFIILYLPMIFSAILLLINLLRCRKLSVLDYLLGSILIANFLCLLIANRFPHYFTIYCPVYILFLFRYIRINWRSLILVVALLCAGMHLFPTLRRTAEKYQTVYGNQKSRYDIISTDIERIPKNERNSVIGYEIQASDYLAINILPCYKYYTLQETWNITTPTIVNDFIEWICKNNPLWVLVAHDKNHPQLNDILNQNYSLMYENQYIDFYRLK